MDGVMSEQGIPLTRKKVPSSKGSRSGNEETGGILQEQDTEARKNAFAASAASNEELDKKLEHQGIQFPTGKL